jgi:hypothetical protein
MMRLESLLATLLVAAACGGSVTTAGGPDGTAGGIEMVASVVSHTSAGDSVTIRMTNTGTRTEFLSRCGAQPLLLMQQFVNGVWTGGVQNFMCIAPSAPGPVRLAPGETITMARVLSVAGHYRFTTSVGEMEDLSDATQTVSNGFDIQ